MKIQGERCYSSQPLLKVQQMLTVRVQPSGQRAFISKYAAIKIAHITILANRLIKHHPLCREWADRHM